MGSTMKGLPEKFGKKRIIDSPVSEAAVTGIATGASLNDMKPIVVHPRMDFMLLAADAIINQSAKWKFMLGGANSPNVTIRSILIEVENKVHNILRACILCLQIFQE